MCQRDALDCPLVKAGATNKTHGFYIECGAYDGSFLSNTYILENYLCWTGLLIEPSRKFFDAFAIRPHSTVVRGALVPPELDNTTIAAGIDDSPTNSAGHDLGKSDYVPAKTIATFLREAGMHDPYGVDFFSLDIEGLELGAVQGLDPYRPKWVVIEVSWEEGTHPSNRDFVLQEMGERGYVVDRFMGEPHNRPPMIQDTLFRYEPARDKHKPA